MIIIGVNLSLFIIYLERKAEQGLKRIFWIFLWVFEIMSITFIWQIFSEKAYF